MKHVLLQFTYSVSQTAQKPEDEWSAIDVRDVKKGVEGKDVQSSRDILASVSRRSGGCHDW